MIGFYNFHNNKDENQPCIQENMWKQVIILPIEITKNSCDDPFYYFAINVN